MKIVLHSKHEVLIDEEDYELISKYTWHFHKSGYAVAEKGTRRIEKRRTFLMHKLIMNTPKGMDTDHINRNGLDNRRCNLRIVDRTQNNFNSSLHSNNKSGHRGIYWVKLIKLWRAYIGGSKSRIELGYFKQKTEAIKARLKAEKLYIKTH